MFEAEKMLKMVLAQANVINKRWQKVNDIEQRVTTQTNIDSYLSLKQENLDGPTPHPEKEKLS